MLSSALTHAEAGLVVASNLAAGNVMGGNLYLSGAHQGSVISAQIQSVSALAQAQAQAQTQAQVQAQAQERQERQIREEQLRLQAERARRDESKPTTAPIDVSPLRPKQMTTPSNNSACQMIKTIKFEGATLLSERKQNKIAAPFVGRCLSADDINSLLVAVTNWYFDKGYISSRAYIQPQDLSTGQLTLTVAEGKIEGFNSKEYPRRAIRGAFATAENSTLNLRRIEQGLDQINRLGTHRASMELVPGKEIGGSVIDLQTQITRPLSVDLRLDNTGQDTTGEAQLGLTANWANPFGILDFLSISTGRQLENVGDNIFSRSASLHYDAPLGYWNFDIDVSWFTYSLEIDSFASTFVSSGVSRNQSFRTSRLLHRNQNSKSGVRVTLGRKQSLNFVEDVRVDTSSRTLTSVSTELWHEKFLSQGTLNNSITWSRGIPWLGGASDDRRVDGQAPVAEFNKLMFSTRLSHQFKAPKPFSGYSLRWSAQYSEDTLFGAEQISVGSQYTVRGFKGAGQGANTGSYLRQEFTFPLPSLPNFLFFQGSSRAPIKLQGSISLDGGVVRNFPDAQRKYGRFSGYGMGVRTTGNKINFSAEYGRALSSPRQVQPNHHDIYLQLSSRF